MLTFLALLAGTALPLCFGWLIVRVVEGKTPVLRRTERWLAAFILGPTAMMLLCFVTEETGLTSFTLAGFLIPTLIAIALLALLVRMKYRTLTPFQTLALPERQYGKTTRTLVAILMVWTVIKLLAGAYDLSLTPTYWDDSFNNWNLRGKAFYNAEHLVLELPLANGGMLDAQGISSYPVALPLMKTWLATLRGEWNDHLVNSVQMIWGIGLLGILYSALRRRTDKTVASLGVYALVSLPLVLIHLSNSYAEIFLASHLLLAIVCLLSAEESTDAAGFAAWIRLAALSTALLLFTKNEASVLYAPILGVLALWILVRRRRSGMIDTAVLKKTVMACIGLFIVFALPWLAFKWSQGLTFGNAKSISGLGIGFSVPALKAIVWQLTHLGSFLILPVVLTLSLVAWRREAFRPPLAILTVFVLLAFAAQVGAFVLFPPLATEAIGQTGFGRGIVQIAPIAILLLALLTKLLPEENVGS